MRPRREPTERKRNVSQCIPDAGPELTFPSEESELVCEAYREARTILEYGSGGSTWLAASQPRKFVLSVESDRDWAIALQARIDAANLPSSTVVWHVDIGPTGRWGRPNTYENWRNYHRYPQSIWTQPFFRHPDVVLIDGRLRPACLVSTCLRITRPVRVLFDDYVNRPVYHEVERLVSPTKTIGRMAVFDLEPVQIRPWMID